MAAKAAPNAIVTAAARAAAGAMAATTALWWFGSGSGGGGNNVDIGLLDLVILGVHRIAASVFSCALGTECLLYFNTMTVRATYMSLSLARMCGK